MQRMGKVKGLASTATIGCLHLLGGCTMIWRCLRRGGVMKVSASSSNGDNFLPSSTLMLPSFASISLLGIDTRRRVSSWGSMASNLELYFLITSLKSWTVSLFLTTTENACWGSDPNIQQNSLRSSDALET